MLKPGGAKWWRFNYTFAGKRKQLSLGVYPSVTLAEARRRAVDARAAIAAGTDPSDTRKEAKVAREKVAEAARRIEAGLPAADSFEDVAREWFGKFRDTWAPSHATKIIERLERDVFPWVGGRPIAAITSFEVLTVLRRIAGRGVLETAHRAKGNCSQIFRYAIATERAERDPCPDLRGALPTPAGGHFASLTEPAKVGELLRAIDAFKGTFVVQCALLLAPLLFARPGELR